MSEKNKLDIIRPFGPAIGKVKIPENILKILNAHVDKIIEDSEKVKKLDYSSKLIGNVKQEIEIESEVAKETGWLDFLGQASSAWIKHSVGREIKNFHLIDSWVVRQFQNEYNPIHYHSGHISGAGFLKVPSNFGKTFQNTKKNVNGQLVLVHGNRQFLSGSMYHITPEVGDFYFFPHYLMHLVYPFRDSNEERRSISFNAHVDENIFNVFGF
tara:strand:+ start:938 stop:1576 length:639 start_codon:yes stop_codon:yes gene_type:complete